MWGLTLAIYLAIGLYVVIVTRARIVMKESLKNYGTSTHSSFREYFASFQIGYPPVWRVALFYMIIFTVALVLWPVFLRSWFAKQNPKKDLLKRFTDAKALSKSGLAKRVDREGAGAAQIINKYRFTSAKWKALLAERGNMDNLMLPNLIIWNEESFLRIRYNEVTHAYEKNGDVMTLSRMELSPQVREAFPAISKIVSGAGGIYLYPANYGILSESKCAFLKLGANLQCSKSRIFNSFGAMVIGSQKIIVAAEGELIVMDENLEDIDKVQLGIPNKRDPWGKEKNAHDILVFFKTAYLLDNILYPMYILDVAIDKPREMAIKRRIIIKGVNAHLDHQWLVPDLEKWFVLKSYSGLEVYGQELYIFPMHDGDKPLAQQYIGGRDCYGDNDMWEAKGLRIVSITPFPPIMALVRDKNEEYFLSQIKTSNQGIEFERIFDIPELANAKGVRAEFVDHLLFIIAEDSIIIINTQTGRISLVESINLANYEMFRIEGVTVLK